MNAEDKRWSECHEYSRKLAHHLVDEGFTFSEIGYITTQAKNMVYLRLTNEITLRTIPGFSEGPEQ